VHVHDPRGRQGIPGSLVDAVAQRAEPAAIRNRVVVEQSDVSAPCFADPGVVPAREPAIVVERDDPHPREPLAYMRRRAVGGGVVDEDGLGVDSLLRRDCGQAGIQVRAPVPRHNHDRDVWSRGHGAATCR
jgi:hypothetical protein